MIDETSTTNREKTSNAQDNLRWAPMREVIGEKRMGNQLEKLKYGVRYFLSRDSRTKFLHKVSDTHFGRTLFESNPTNFYVPLRSYLDSRFTVKDRFDVCLKDIETAQLKFGDSHSNNLLKGGKITLAFVGQFTVELLMNRVSQHEGFWAISIKDSTGKAISNLSFGFLNSETILIASVQGIKDPSRNILELNKQLTKQAFGLRPQNLLVATIQTLCSAWEIKNLLGIDPKDQVKRRINTERQGFKFDYLGFWTELGGIKNFSGYWNLTHKAPIKEMADVPSHKRSQYRKRNQLIDLISENSTGLFRVT
jgi:uncharacterized protein VirK/YbjX